MRQRTLQDGFPFTLPIVRNMPEIEFRSPVTFLVGENGAGKSTLLEAIAAAVNAVAIGAERMHDDPSLAPARRLADALRVARGPRPKASFFFRAEDMFGFQKKVADEEDFEKNLDGYGRQLATGVVRGQRRALEGRYGENPDALSHGEVFLSILQSRLAPNGLYFMDEPETPLSPTRVLALISILKEGVDCGSQFVVATHSPILMAFPEADILALDGDTLTRVAYDEVEHVVVTRSFLRNPDSYLSKL
jgi:predicted ATPase